MQREADCRVDGAGALRAHVAKPKLIRQPKRVDRHPDIGSPLLLDLPQRRWLQLQLVDSKFEVG